MMLILTILIKLYEMLIPKIDDFYKSVTFEGRAICVVKICVRDRKIQESSYIKINGSMCCYAQNLLTGFDDCFCVCLSGLREC